MSYRTYIGFMPKREYNKIKSMTEQQLVEFYSIEVDEKNRWYKGVYEYGKKLYEFVKYTDFNPPKKSLKPFFKNKELMDKHYHKSEYHFYVVTKEFLEYIIERYKQRIVDYYNKMLNPVFKDKNGFFETKKIEYEYPDNNITFDFSKITPKEQNALNEIIQHVHDMSIEWTHLTPFELNDQRPEITHSWKYEYAIFELVRIYKYFDWKKNVMIYYGY